jgi:hypothetical protein
MTYSDDKLLVGTDPELLTLECRQLREQKSADFASADEVIDFLDGYNAFINHASRPFSPMLEVKMLL